MKEYIVKVFEDRTMWLNKCGQLHRIDGPAIEYSNGSKSWWINGELHREDGPAIEYSNGSNEWYVEGKRHRLDGPAFEWNDGYKEWYLYDERLTEEEFNNRTQHTKELSVKELEKLLGYKVKIVKE
jgi:hypothetical protein